MVVEGVQDQLILLVLVEEDMNFLLKQPEELES